MNEASKYLLGQGVLGVLCVALGWAVWYLWRENRRLMERLETKSDKQAEKNEELTRQVTDAFNALSEQRRRRKTVRQMGEPPVR